MRPIARATLAGLALLTLLLVGCPTEPIRHEPVMTDGPSGDATSIVLAGSLYNEGPCELMEVVEGPDDAPEIVSITIELPPTVQAWMDQALQRSTVQLQPDPWGSWLQMRSRFELPDLGATLRGRRTGANDICVGERYAAFRVDEVLGLYDLDGDENYPNPSNMLLSREGYDLEDEEIEQVFQAGLSGVQGQPRPMTVEVRGTWGSDEEVPPWELREPRAGYLILEYANPSVVPDEQGMLNAILIEEGVSDIAQLPDEEAEAILEEIYEQTRGGEYTYEGYFTGEVRFTVGQESVAASPVFMVTSEVVDD